MREHLTKLQDYDREKDARGEIKKTVRSFFRRGSVWPCRYSLHRKLSASGRYRSDTVDRRERSDSEAARDPWKIRND